MRRLDAPTRSAISCASLGFTPIARRILGDDARRLRANEFALRRGLHRLQDNSDGELEGEFRRHIAEPSARRGAPQVFDQVAPAR